MRNKLLSVMTLLAIAVSPTAAIAEPDTLAKKTVPDENIVENIKQVIDPFETPTKEQIAQKQIEENIKKLDEERKRAEAVAAAKAAEEAAKAAAAQAAPQVTHVTPRGDFSALYAAAGARFGVNPAILAAVHMVESGGRGDTQVASYAGAQGPMQFIPSTWRAYAVDGDGDGVANIYDVHDAVFTAAKYLAANGAASGSVTAALLRYNHSMAYVNHVLSIARSYGYAG